MSVVEDIRVGRYLEDLMAVVARATPGPLSVARGSDGRYTLRSSSGAVVAVVHRAADAAVFARDRVDLRALVTALAEVMGRHRDDGAGRCVEDGQPLACLTLRELELQLGALADVPGTGHAGH